MLIDTYINKNRGKKMLSYTLIIVIFARHHTQHIQIFRLSVICRPTYLNINISEDIHNTVTIFQHRFGYLSKA